MADTERYLREKYMEQCDDPNEIEENISKVEELLEEDSDESNKH